MEIDIKYRIMQRWGHFSYNFSWNDFIPLFESRITKYSSFAPLVGYIIVFNDLTVSEFSFSKIASVDNSGFIFESISRLRMIYFGLMSIGISYLVYVLRRPRVHKHAKSEREFIEFGLSATTAGEFFDLHGEIQNDGHFTMHGKYYSSEWDGFSKLAFGDEGSVSSNANPSNWGFAKSQYENLLRSILKEVYFRRSRTKRVSLIVCLLFSLLGYMLLSISSIDLFQAIVRATFFDFFA